MKLFSVSSGVTGVLQDTAVGLNILCAILPSPHLPEIIMNFSNDVNNIGCKRQFFKNQIVALSHKARLLCK